MSGGAEREFGSKRRYRAGEAVTFRLKNGEEFRGKIRYDEGMDYDRTSMQDYSIVDMRGIVHDYIPIALIRPDGVLKSTRGTGSTDWSHGKSIGCYGCSRTFATYEDLTAHERASGHGALNEHTDLGRWENRGALVHLHKHHKGHHRHVCDPTCRAGGRGHTHDQASRAHGGWNARKRRGGR